MGLTRLAHPHTAMEATDLIGKTVVVEIDRPLGSKHPQHDLVYELNYGFVPGLLAPDGEFLDAYILGDAFPLKPD
jgi:inorganic pyrophosphatase